MSAPDSTAVRPARLDRRYWMCNVVEMWERLAYYSARPIAGVYIMQADDPGGLHLTAAHRGVIFAWWSFVQSLLPTVTGGLADRYGYRRTLVFALSVNALGYALMAAFHSYAGFFSGCLVLAFGTAFFKPAVHGTIAHCLTRETSSLGWGIFYMVVNVGSQIGHLVTPFILGDASRRTAAYWSYVFLACAGVSVINLLTLAWYPKIASGSTRRESPLEVLRRTLRDALEPRLFSWLLIMSGFWMMMYQLWDMHPNFIQDWIDSTAIAARLPVRAWTEIGPDGLRRVQQQVLLSIDSTLIILLVGVMSLLVRRMRTLSAMVIGMAGVTAGILVSGLSRSGWNLLGGIALFSLGEMIVGPKTSEYLALIAPADKKGRYLGYANIPTGIGQGLGGFLAGVIYGDYGEKATLALRYIVDYKLVPLNTASMPGPSDWSTLTGIPRTEAFARLQALLGQSGSQVTQLLWDTYSPHTHVWLPFAAVGVAAGIALTIYGRLARRWSDLNA
ncbi:MAG: MFS transporter [Phycisphaerae bacterium]